MGERRERVAMTERQRDRERQSSNTSSQGRVRGGRREHDREATREIDTCNTSNKGRVREGQRARVAMTERQQESEREMHPTRITKEECERDRERVAMTERQRERDRQSCNTSNQGRVKGGERE